MSHHDLNTRFLGLLQEGKKQLRGDTETLWPGVKVAHFTAAHILLVITQSQPNCPGGWETQRNTCNVRQAALCHQGATGRHPFLLYSSLMQLQAHHPKGSLEAVACEAFLKVLFKSLS